MDNLIDAILGFISKAVAILLISSSVCLLAGEVRLATLKKASQGTMKLSKQTARMTGIKFP